MSDIIQLLPDSVANQIAAGEVIQRPASVVKELVENAIDAGATSIQVVLKDAGRTLIQVIDNGKGMSVTDARLAFERHATSKIRKADDLFALSTMGFRGEALASIAAIAQVELRTRREEDEVGTSVRISGSEVESQEPVSTPVGSNFQVKNLFYNVPARRKFLKQNDTELSNIMTEFERIALVNHTVSFSIFHNDNERLNLPATNIRQRILNTLGKGLNKQLLSVEVDTTLISMSGYIGRPESARKKKALQYFFVNGRYMRHPYFHKAVMQSYDQILAPGENPNYFIYFDIDPANIDVNIHPTKTEIKFENETFIWQIISAAVKEALGKFSAVPSIDFDTEDAPDIPVFKQENVKMPQPKFDSSYNPFRQSSPASSSPSTSAARPDYDWQKLYGGFENADDMPMRESEATSFESKMSSGFESRISTGSADDVVESKIGSGFEDDPDYFHTDSPFDQPLAVFPQELLVESGASDTDNGQTQTFASKFVDDEEEEAAPADILFRASENEIVESSISTSAQTTSVFGNSEKDKVGNQYLQFKGKYILTSVKSGLMIIDQHRAHVRVLFDQYIERINSRKGVSHGVLFPEILSFTPSEVPVLESIIEDLQFLGFEINNMGGCSYSVNAIPAGTEGLDVESLLHSMIDTALYKARDVKSDMHESVALSLAEAAAIPYGEWLNPQAMEKLIDDLFASSSPNYTPDGKLIISMESTDEIGKRFR